MQIRSTEISDIPAVMEIIDQAKAYFKKNCIDQWQRGVPNSEVIMNDIRRQCSYVLCEEQKILATCVILFEDDPNYAVISEGQWLNGEPYGVIHRIAVRNDQKGKGLASEFFAYAEQEAERRNVHNLRVDTHADNLSMQRVIAKNGFVKCGTVFVSKDEQRFAYQKILK